MKINILFITISILLISCNQSINKQNQSENVLSVDTVTQVDVADTDTISIAEQQKIQLIKKHELSDKDLYIDYDGGNQLADFFVIELIDKSTFIKNQSLAVNLLIQDTLAIRKTNGVLRIPYANGEINFIDNLLSEYNYKEYTYRGQIKKLNVYLISGIYWEDWNYFFVDQYTGKTLQTFASEPHVSADGRFIISIDVDTFEGATYLDLYEVTDKRRIEQVVGLYVKKWVPVNSFGNMYWANDNFLYIPVVNTVDFWSAEGNYAGLDQYIRLKPVA